MQEFDIDSREILLEIDTGVYVLDILLRNLPLISGLLSQDKVLKSLHNAMVARVMELYPNPAEGSLDIEKMLVCAFSKVV